MPLGRSPLAMLFPWGCGMMRRLEGLGSWWGSGGWGLVFSGVWLLLGAVCAGVPVLLPGLLLIVTVWGPG